MDNNIKEIIKEIIYELFESGEIQLRTKLKNRWDETELEVSLIRKIADNKSDLWIGEIVLTKDEVTIDER